MKIFMTPYDMLRYVTICHDTILCRMGRQVVRIYPSGGCMTWMVWSCVEILERDWLTVNFLRITRDQEITKT